MIVVVEGPDNAGKSTLIAHLTRKLGISYVPGEGPAKSEEEINDRVARYLDMDGVIFDRHPCVSQGIYNNFRKGYEVNPNLVNRFYQQDVLFVYCRGRSGVEGHVLKPHDQRLDMAGVVHEATVRDNYRAICQVYDTWALNWAHVNYRIGDGYEIVTRFVAEAMNERFDPLQDVIDFHEKYGLMYDGPPRAITPFEQQNFRHRFLQEEKDEYVLHSGAAFDECTSATLDGSGPDIANYSYHLENALDALIDGIYVGLGSAVLHGFAPVFKEAWRRVQVANMSKIRATRPDDSKRGSTFDVVKPKDWKAPSHIDLVEQNDLSLKR